MSSVDEPPAGILILLDQRCWRASSSASSSARRPSKLRSEGFGESMTLGELHAHTGAEQ